MEEKPMPIGITPRSPKICGFFPEEIEDDSWELIARTSEAGVPQNEKLSNVESILSFVKGFIGTGILFMPRGFEYGGYIFSPFGMIFLFVVACLGYFRLVEAQQYTHGSYTEVAEKCFGKWMKFVVEIFLLICQIPTSTGHAVITILTLNDIFLSWGYDINLIYFGLFWLILLCPLTYAKNLATLYVLYIVGDILLLLLLGVIIFHAIQNLMTYEVNIDVKPFNPKTWLMCYGMAMYTIENIPVVLPLYRTMKNRNHFGRVIICSMTTVFLLITVTAMISYIGYGGKLTELVTLEMEQTSFVKMVIIGYIVSLIPTSAITLYPANKILHKWWLKGASEMRPSWYFTWKESVLNSCVVVFATTLAIIFVHKWDKFMSLDGAWSCAPLGMIFPAMVNLKVVRNASCIKKTTNWMLILIGVMSIFMTSYSTFINWNVNHGK